VSKSWGGEEGVTGKEVRKCDWEGQTTKQCGISGEDRVSYTSELSNQGLSWTLSQGCPLRKQSHRPFKSKSHQTHWHTQSKKRSEESGQSINIICYTHSTAELAHNQLQSLKSSSVRAELEGASITGTSDWVYSERVEREVSLLLIENGLWFGSPNFSSFYGVKECHQRRQRSQCL
jgi:hypothetical protein